MSILSKDPSIYSIELPSSRTDEEMILKWLETKGFNNLTNTRPVPYSTFELEYLCNGLNYCIGKHDADDLSTWWVGAGDGEGNAVLVRTVEEHLLRKDIPFGICTICNSGCSAREGSWEEARQLLEEMVR